MKDDPLVLFSFTPVLFSTKDSPLGFFSCAPMPLSLKRQLVFPSVVPVPLCPSLLSPLCLSPGDKKAQNMAYPHRYRTVQTGQNFLLWTNLRLGINKESDNRMVCSWNRQFGLTHSFGDYAVQYDITKARVVRKALVLEGGGGTVKARCCLSSGERITNITIKCQNCHFQTKVKTDIFYQDHNGHLLVKVKIAPSNKGQNSYLLDKS